MLDPIAKSLSTVLPFVYLLAAAAYLVQFARERDNSRLPRFALIVAVIVHLLTVATKWAAAGSMPVAHISGALTFFTLCTALVYGVVERRAGTQSVGVFIIGLVLIFQTVASIVYQPAVPLPEKLASGWFVVHAGTSLVSFSAFSISAAMSTLYLLLYRELHSARPGPIFKRIPSLESLGRMSHTSVKIGFTLLTVGLATGTIWAKSVWGSFWSWDPKQCSSLTVWLIYGGYLWARSRRGWSARNAAFFATVGFVLLVFTFLFVEVLFHTEHRFI